jgi:hypothetical protein
LVIAACAAVRVKASYRRPQFLCIKARRGAKKAVFAVAAAAMLTAAFRMLLRSTEYNDLGSERFDRRHKPKTALRHLKRPSRPRLRCS